MKVEIRELSSPDIFDLDDAFFPEGAPFSILLVAAIGEVGGKGADLFYVVAISAEALREKAAEGASFLRHYLLMNSFDAKAARRAIERLCERNSGPDWPAIAAKLSRYMKWEFEDYRGQM
jgi:hypothetical protein